MQQQQRTPSGYSLNTGVSKQPCCRPYESDDDSVTGGMRLDFNYWVSNGTLVDQQVQDIIMSILNDDCNTFISFRKTFKIKHLVVVTLHGIDPTMLQLHLSSLSFMNKLSYVPIRHTTSPRSIQSTIHCGACGGVNQWHATEIVPMNTLLLWTEVPPIKTGSRFLLGKDNDESHGQQPVSATSRETVHTLHRLFRDGIQLFKVKLHYDT